eukprot:CAMPEP_0171270016 /NCGR_PEP_ID=MMETSP0790-20130122/60491_1 /TAXON_ID=2925 /ORGANISM="Alexandrium catenella, Strain OF101" /LENGTH=252 /DNA_ID=CAMNT_0011738839 /DNA_START=314 /DNA_END=1073 /DNA_ORIENTATION=+
MSPRASRERHPLAAAGFLNRAGQSAFIAAAPSMPPPRDPRRLRAPEEEAHRPRSSARLPLALLAVPAPLPLLLGLEEAGLEGPVLHQAPARAPLPPRLLRRHLLLPGPPCDGGLEGMVGSLGPLERLPRVGHSVLLLPAVVRAVGGPDHPEDLERVGLADAAVAPALRAEPAHLQDPVVQGLALHLLGPVLVLEGLEAALPVTQHEGLMGVDVAFVALTAFFFITTTIFFIAATVCFIALTICPASRGGGTG